MSNEGMVADYRWSTEREGIYVTVTIFRNEEPINVVEGFIRQSDAERYGEAYIQGYRDAKGDLFL